jgi:hypothetical protein
MNDGALRTRSLLEELPAVTSAVWDGTAALHHRVDELLRELAQPMLADIPMHLPFRVEPWDRSEQHLRLGSLCVVQHCDGARSF